MKRRKFSSYVILFLKRHARLIDFILELSFWLLCLFISNEILGPLLAEALEMEVPIAKFFVDGVLVMSIIFSREDFNEKDEN